jgi:hypothetical protein
LSRSSIVVAIVVIAILGAGAALALGLFDGDEEEPPEAAESAPASTTTLGVTTSVERTPPITAMTASPGEDPLCLAHAEMVAALDGHLPVQGAEDLEAVRTAALDFYTEAVGHVDPPERDDFSDHLGYEQEVYNWSEANEWSPERSLEDLTENPPPTVPAEALAVVTRVLADRCDVVAVRE